MTREGIQRQIQDYLASHSEPERSEMAELHRLILKAMPGCELWFLDGKNAEGRVVSNPNIGYGRQTTKLAGGKSKEFYRVGLSANQAGISVYIMGLADKTLLPKRLRNKIGKATVTGYCIKFRSLKDVHVDVLLAAIGDAVR